MKSVRRILSLTCLSVWLLCGCRVQNYMVGMIVNGELDKMANEKAHQCVNVAKVTRGDSTSEIHYTVDFEPTDRLRFTYDPSSENPGFLTVTTESYLLYDPELNRAERVINLPAFSNDSFKEFRRFALRNTLKYNEVRIVSSPEDPKQFWELRTTPLAENQWTNETVSYITKDTRNNIRGLERNQKGKIINEFETREKTFEVQFEPGHFQIQPPADAKVIIYDLATLTDKADTSGAKFASIPKEYEGLALARIKETDDLNIYDYTIRQMVFFYAQSRHQGEQLLESPVSREMDLAFGKAYMNYAGTYTTCRWRQGEWDHLIFTNLGPEIALVYAEKVSPALAQEAEGFQAMTAGGSER